MDIITPAEALALDLSAHAESINAHIDLITGHEEAFEESTLEARLLIGVEILKAQAVFGMTIPNPQGVNQHTKEVVSRRDTTSHAEPDLLGFSSWIARSIPRLKRTTAIKYANAFKVLDIPAGKSTPARIRNKIKDLRHKAGKAGEPMPTLASLIKAGKANKAGETALIIAPPQDSAALRLQDAREHWHVWREKAEKLVNSGYLDDLDKPALLQLQEFSLWLRDRLKARLK